MSNNERIPSWGLANLVKVSINHEYATKKDLAAIIDNLIHDLQIARAERDELEAKLGAK